MITKKTIKKLKILLLRKLKIMSMPRVAKIKQNSTKLFSKLSMD